MLGPSLRSVGGKASVLEGCVSFLTLSILLATTTSDLDKLLRPIKDRPTIIPPYTSPDWAFSSLWQHNHISRTLEWREVFGSHSSLNQSIPTEAACTSEKFRLVCLPLSN